MSALKDPKDRAHFWERPAVEPTAPAPASTDYPRHVHKAEGLHLVVADDDALAAAIADGWSLTPIVEA